MRSAKRNGDQDVQERICRLATRLFCQKGYRGTSVSQIVHEAGVTKPVLYYYFGSKAGLFNHLFSRHFNAFREMLEKAIRLEGTTREKMLRLTLDQFAFSHKHFDQVRFLIATVLGPQKGIPRVRIREFNRINTRLFSRILSAGVTRGEIRPLPLEEVGHAYLGIVNMFLFNQLMEKHWALNRKVAERLVDILFSGIGARTNAKFAHKE